MTWGIELTGVERADGINSLSPAALLFIRPSGQWCKTSELRPWAHLKNPVCRVPPTQHKMGLLYFSFFLCTPPTYAEKGERNWTTFPSKEEKSLHYRDQRQCMQIFTWHGSSLESVGMCSHLSTQPLISQLSCDALLLALWILSSSSRHTFNPRSVTPFLLCILPLTLAKTIISLL